jgi:hypothetical protein
MKVIINTYDGWVGVLLAWLQPLMRWMVEIVNSHFQLSLVIYPHWKHIFVFMTVYFFRAAAINYSYGYRSSGIFAFFWGAFIAFVIAGASGTIQSASGNNDLEFVAASIPIVGIFLYDLPKQLWDASFTREHVATIYNERVQGWWEFFKPNLYLIVNQMLWSVLLVWATLKIPIVESAKSPSLVSIAVLVFALALYRGIIGAIEVKGLKRESEPWLSAFNRTSGAGIAVSILGLFFWVAVFLISSAGLKFYGL